MSTLRQKNLAKIVLENPELIKDGKKSELVELGGYSKAVQKTPAKVLDSIGFKAELAKFGLTEELITRALVNDIKAKPKKRKAELELGAEILGMKKRDPQPEVPRTIVAIQIVQPQSGGNNPSN